MKPTLLLKILTSTVLILAIGTGCAGKKRTPADLTLSKDGHVSKITLPDFGTVEQRMLIPTGIKGLFGKMMIMDDLLVCANLRDSAALDIYNLQSGQLVKQVITRGDSTRQCLGVESLLKADQPHRFWLYDITTSKLLLVDLQKALQQKSYQPEQDIQLKENLKNMYSPRLVHDSLFAGVTYSQSDSRYFYFDTHSQIIQKNGKLPSFEKTKLPVGSSKLNIMALILSSSLERAQGKNVHAVAYKKTDRIELYENDVLKKLIIGPEHFEPVQQFRKEHDIILPEDSPKTRYAFVNTVSDNDYIYCLYSGRENINSGNQILVFDWGGNPVKRLLLQEEAYMLTVTEKSGKKLLYTIAEKNNEVSRIEF
jgi:hypothetical protein